MMKASNVCIERWIRRDTENETILIKYSHVYATSWGWILVYVEKKQDHTQQKGCRREGGRKNPETKERARQHLMSDQTAQ